ncbi:fungal-specific transcription factor domain-domain-containing protein [Naematelia encephala]|uniref:Fungal-specific transcription factor domain-domain-containing protein n=1 Tax=Naematelia encephala TaxID=71784 RepID=A0A1Y2BIF6_9TREE|nr:fungal-specific transcription factor domain-domain-containing protein [Naematelia encephala]
MMGVAQDVGSSRKQSQRSETPYKKRRYAVACLPCRERKIKCEGGDLPPCQGCRAAAITCIPSSSTRAKRPRTPSVAQTPERLGFEERMRRVEAILGIEDDVELPLDDPEETKVERSALDHPRFAFGSLDRPVYHGETSMHNDFDTPPGRASRDSISAVEDGSSWSMARLRALCKTKHRYVSPEEGEFYLDAYFCWASITYSAIYRPTFIRDMALDGPYFSPFLLIVIYISAIRFAVGLSEEEREIRGDRLVSIAMGMIAQEIAKPSGIPTIQALIGLAGRQASVGNNSQAWLLTGMGIRMMQDMGIHLPHDDRADSRFTAEEREIRTRLYWSAYCWDKTLGLSLGREPALLCRNGDSPDCIQDESDDQEPWVPYYPPGVTPPARASTYPHQPRLTIFTLRHSCQLNIILESILTNMYSIERPNARSLSFIRTADERLVSWLKNLPRELWLDINDLPAVSPPTHIVTLNLLYSVMQILLYRPLLTAQHQPADVVSSALDKCRSAAVAVNEILSLWGRTFGHINMVYLMMYSCFVAAGVDVLLLRVGTAAMRKDALNRVLLSLDILEKASHQGPGIKRGIEIIKTQLERATRGDFDVDVTGTQTNSGTRLTPIKQDPTSSIHPSVADLSTQTLVTSDTTLVPPSSDNLNTPGFLLSHDRYDPAAANTPQYLLDAQDLLNFLGETQISTDDPFAFASDGTWQGWN